MLSEEVNEATRAEGIPSVNLAHTPHGVWAIFCVRCLALHENWLEKWPLSLSPMVAMVYCIELGAILAAQKPKIAYHSDHLLTASPAEMPVAMLLSEAPN